MSTAAKLRRAPGRVAAGAFILNSGLSKLKADEETTKGLHGMAVGAYPFLDRVDAKTFVRALSAAEITLGGALLLPIVPVAVAGAGLAAFSGGLVGLYWRTPGMHPDGDPRPTEQGLALSKDTWLAGIAGGLLLDALIPDVRTRRAERRAAKAEARATRAEAKFEKSKQRRSAKASARKVARAQAEAARGAARSAVAGTRSAVDSALVAAKQDAVPLIHTAAGNVGAASQSVKSAAVAARDAIGDALP